MGLPPDDMIGILGQTNIQNRIREWPSKRHLIQRCSCVISFKMPSFFLSSPPLSKVGRTAFRVLSPLLLHLNRPPLAWRDSDKGVPSCVNWYVSVYLINSYLFSLERLRKRVSVRLSGAFSSRSMRGVHYRQMYAGMAARQRSGVSADPNWALATPKHEQKVAQRGGFQRKASTFAPLGDCSNPEQYFLTGCWPSRPHWLFLQPNTTVMAKSKLPDMQLWLPACWVWMRCLSPAMEGDRRVMLFTLRLHTFICLSVS